MSAELKTEVVGVLGPHPPMSPTAVALRVELSWEQCLSIVRTGTVPEPVVDDMMVALLALDSLPMPKGEPEEPRFSNLKVKSWRSPDPPNPKRLPR